MTLVFLHPAYTSLWGHHHHHRSWPSCLPLRVPCASMLGAAALLVLLVDSPSTGRSRLTSSSSLVRKEGPRSSHHAFLFCELAFSSLLCSRAGAGAEGLWSLWSLALAHTLTLFFLTCSTRHPWPWFAPPQPSQSRTASDFDFLLCICTFWALFAPRKVAQRLPRGPIASAGCSCRPSCGSGVSMSTRHGTRGETGFEGEELREGWEGCCGQDRDADVQGQVCMGASLTCSSRGALHAVSALSPTEQPALQEVSLPSPLLPRRVAAFCCTRTCHFGSFAQPLLPYPVVVIPLLVGWPRAVHTALVTREMSGFILPVCVAVVSAGWTCSDEMTMMVTELRFVRRGQLNNDTSG